MFQFHLKFLIQRVTLRIYPETSRRNSPFRIDRKEISGRIPRDPAWRFVIVTFGPPPWVPGTWADPKKSDGSLEGNAGIAELIAFSGGDGTLPGTLPQTRKSLLTGMVCFHTVGVARDALQEFLIDDPVCIGKHRRVGNEP